MCNMSVLVFVMSLSGLTMPSESPIVPTGMIGGSYDSFLSYEPFPFDTDYLNTKIPADSPAGTMEKTTAAAAAVVGEPDLNESAASVSSSEEVTSGGPILPPSPPNAI